jgi:DNA-binding CsgD family transcriptional regulator
MHIAREALDRLTETTRAGGTEYGLGIEARSRALLNKGNSAERNYSEAIGRLSRTRRRPELARAHLLFGEWLRRERRSGEARDHLRTAYQMLDAMGMEAFAERARRELLAAGGTIAKRPVQGDRSGTALTAQEAQVARLAQDGLSNPQIAARLFISARTVQYHLGKVFAKLSIRSRGELHRVLRMTRIRFGQA